MFRLILATCIAGVPLIATGQSMIYKVQMPDGSVMYSDSVPSGAKVLEERESKSTPRVNTVPSPPGAAKGISPAQGAVTRPGNAAVPILRPGAPAKAAAPAENISNLERDLAVAKRKLELGREPLPGERRGLAGGGSRLTPEYEARIAAMEKEVAATEAKLRNAYDNRRN
jgi:hypothetical protein